MINIEIKATKPVEYTIKEQIDGWFLLEISHYDVEIQDIIIDGTSVGSIIYTGQIYTNNGDHVYGTVIWEPSIWQIWLHEHVGILQARLLEEINDIHFDRSLGINLEDRYLHTVDRPIVIPDQYSVPVKQYFAAGTGPHWFDKEDNANLPYKEIDIDIDGNDLLTECQNFPIELPLSDYAPGWQGMQLVRDRDNNRRVAPDPGVKIDNLPGTCAELYRQLDWNWSHTFKWLGLVPNAEIMVHRDSHMEHNPVFFGCNKFYWCINNPPGFMFKFTGVGLIPVDKPLQMNTRRYSHALINGPEYRHTIESWGEKIILDNMA